MTGDTIGAVDEPGAADAVAAGALKYFCNKHGNRRIKTFKNSVNLVCQ